jgi:hypothetical protein
MRSNLPLTHLACRFIAASAPFLAACGTGAGSDPAPSASAVGPAWVTHHDAAGAFEASFPGPPKLDHVEPRRKSPQEARVSVENAQYVEETRLLVATKVVMTEVPTYDCAAGMAAMASSTMTGMGCTATDGVDVEVQGLPSRDFAFTCEKRPMQGRLRIICDARRVREHAVTAYSMLVAHREDVWNADEAKRFVESFALLPAP